MGGQGGCRLIDEVVYCRRSRVSSASLEQD